MKQTSVINFSPQCAHLDSTQHHPITRRGCDKSVCSSEERMSLPVGNGCEVRRLWFLSHDTWALDLCCC